MEEQGDLALVHSDELLSRPLKPFIRWAGSKRLLLRNLLLEVPAEYKVYHEPFLGGGSLFLAASPKRAVVGDSLSPLAATWLAVRDHPEELIRRVEVWDLDKNTYLEVRRFKFEDPLDVAAQFVFLNKGAYGGLWRVNSAGAFNVPWATPKTASPLDRANIRAVSDYLRASNVEITNADFREATQRAVRGDFIFLDPPYSKGRTTRPFVHYNETLFGWEDQKALADEARRLRRIGATVLITNSAHPDVSKLFEDFRKIEVVRHSSLGSHAGSTRVLREQIFSSH